MALTRYSLLSDLPPIENGGVASHSISWNICQAFKQCNGTLVTRRYHRSINPKEIHQRVEIPTYLYPDASLLGLRKLSESFRFGIDALMIRYSAPRIARFLAAHRTERILTFPYNHWLFLPAALSLKRYTRLPTDLYLVDDLEASALMQGARSRAYITSLVEGSYLKKFDRVFLISQGYQEHIAAKYGVQGFCLPPLVRAKHEGYIPFRGDSQSIRWLAFSGSVNALYQDALQGLFDALSVLNNTQNVKYGVRFFVVAAKNLREIFDSKGVPLDVKKGLDNQSLIEGLRESYACLLPYSFRPELKTMVSTAFSCKIAEYLVCGRPILVFGPKYSSMPRHFLKHDLPLVETSRERIGSLVLATEKFDNPGLVEAYRKLLEDSHSPAAFLGQLTTPAAPRLC